MSAPPLLIALSGRTGAGKTTLAYALARTIPFLHGALTVGDDEVRREILAYDLATPMPPEAYAPDVSARVTQESESRMAEALKNGRAVINHAGFYLPASRERIHAFARAHKAHWIGLWLEAPETDLIARVQKRLEDRARGTNLHIAQGHASDACLSVLLEKFGSLRAPDKDPSWILLDALGSRQTVTARAARIIKQAMGAYNPNT